MRWRNTEFWIWVRHFPWLKLPLLSCGAISEGMLRYFLFDYCWFCLDGWEGKNITLFLVKLLHQEGTKEIRQIIHTCSGIKYSPCISSSGELNNNSLSLPCMTVVWWIFLDGPCVSVGWISSGVIILLVCTDFSLPACICHCISNGSSLLPCQNLWKYNLSRNAC